MTSLKFGTGEETRTPNSGDTTQPVTITVTPAYIGAREEIRNPTL